ncbi:ORF6N domain-containing protein [bacterium]|nr:ORF6N domain-containing protein [bacterium]
MGSELSLSEGRIKDKIYTIRGLQVMIDSDLAELYGVSTKRLNEQVRRNIERFPEHFMFRLTESEYDILRSRNATSSKYRSRSQNATLDNDRLRCQNGTLERQDEFRFQNGTLEEDSILRFQNGTSSSKPNKVSQNVTPTQEHDRGSQIVTTRPDWGGRRTLPYVFTEQGVSMLSGVLRSKTAVRVSIQIIDAFVALRKFISKNAELFRRLDNVERKHIEYDKNFEKVFDALQTEKPKQGIFYNGQVFDAHRFISDLIRSAKKSIILIDNYIDDSVLTLFSKRKRSVEVVVYTNHISRQLTLDLKKYNSQYDPITIKEFKNSHDRFIIIDSRDVYHIGASLKDLGKRWFAFSKFDVEAFEIVRRLSYL